MRGQNSILRVRGAAELVSESSVEAAADAIASAQWLLVNLGVLREVALRAMEVGAEAGTSVLFDPAPVCEGLDEMWPLVSICTPNELETESIAGIMPDSVPRAVEAAEWFRGRGVRTPVITLGGDGCVVVDDAGARLVRAFEVETVDTTACGDAFSGALATRLAEGAAVDDAVIFASAAGALAATVFGAQPSLPSREGIEALMTEQEDAGRVASV